ncbi:hypothetical protein SSBR45G_40310 [Bradyrhizobium sp. SSBR45G]|nr:hypothetical protein SSBR45G_40310 [Bradyrhizobium sp. SSBR45G]
MVVEKGLDVDAGGRWHRFCFPWGALFWLVDRDPQGHAVHAQSAPQLGGLTGYVTESVEPRQRRAVSISYSETA